MNRVYLIKGAILGVIAFLIRGLFGPMAAGIFIALVAAIAVMGIGSQPLDEQEAYGLDPEVPGFPATPWNN
jgi:hypothetical protein